MILQEPKTGTVLKTVLITAGQHIQPYPADSAVKLRRRRGAAAVSLHQGV